MTGPYRGRMTKRARRSRPRLDTGCLLPFLLAIGLLVAACSAQSDRLALREWPRTGCGSFTEQPKRPWLSLTTSRIDLPFSLEFTIHRPGRLSAIIVSGGVQTMPRLHPCLNIDPLRILSVPGVYVVAREFAREYVIFTPPAPVSGFPFLVQVMCLNPTVSSSVYEVTP